MMWDNIEDAFKELDGKEYAHYAKALGAYFKALLDEGFTREEAAPLVHTYSKFLYDMTLEEFTSEKRREEAEVWLKAEDDEDPPVDDYDE